MYIRINPKAFSLAEVLLALTIVGIIAAIAIPPLLLRLQDIQFKTAFKQEFSTFNQAYSKVQQTNILPTTSLPSITNELNNYYSHVKECNTDSRTEGCWHKDNEWNDLDGTPMVSGGAGKGIILNNGSLLYQYSLTTGANECYYYPAVIISANNYCGGYLIDVNGFKGPNTLGKDIFSLYLSSKRTMPGGTLSGSCDPSQSLPSNGEGCAFKVLMNQNY